MTMKKKETHLEIDVRHLTIKIVGSDELYLDTMILLMSKLKDITCVSENVYKFTFSLDENLDGILTLLRNIPVHILVVTDSSTWYYLGRSYYQWLLSLDSEPAYDDKKIVDSHILKRGSESSNYIIRKMVADYDHTPINMLKTLSKDKSDEVRRAVAYNLLSRCERMFASGSINITRTAAQIMSELSKDKDWYVRHYVELSYRFSVSKET